MSKNTISKKQLKKIDYEKQRMELKIEAYENLRKHWQKTVNHVLGNGYYNMEMDFRRCDEQTCEDMRNAFDAQHNLIVILSVAVGFMFTVVLILAWKML